MTRISTEHDQTHGEPNVIFIDKQQYKVTTPHLTVREILQLRFGSNVDVTVKLLTLRHGNDITKFEDPDAAVLLENGLHFVVLDQSPTTVS